jgi:MFS family permease
MDWVHLNSTFVFTVFMLSSIVAVSGKLISWFRREQTKSAWLTQLQIRYFVSYYAFMSGLTFQGPYVYQRYLDSGLNSAQIGTIMSTFNIVSSLWGLFIGYAIDLLGHKRLIILSAMFLSIHASLRYAGGFWSFVVGAAVMGLSTASNKVVFEDWLMNELQAPGAPDQKLSQAIVQENSALIRLISTLVMTPISAKVTHLFGSSAAFCISSLMVFTSIGIIQLCMQDWKPIDSAKPRQGYFQSIKAIVVAIRGSKELLLLLLVDFCYNIFFLIYSPRWLSIHQIDKKEKLPLSQIGNTNTIVLMSGAQIFSAVLAAFAAKTSVLIGFVVYLISVVGIYVFFPNKNCVYFFFVCSGIADGVIGTAMRVARGLIYPREIRGYILGLLRVPSSLCVSAVIFMLKGYDDVRYLVVACLCWLGLAAFFSVLLRKHHNNTE